MAQRVAGNREIMSIAKPHIRVIVPVVRLDVNYAALSESLEAPFTQVTVDATDTGPSSIECDYDVALSAPGTLSAVIRAEEAGADAVVIDCMADPALAAAREVARIPVFGTAQTTMHIAAMLSHRFAILTVFQRSVVLLENLAAQYGISSKLAGLRPFNIPVLDLEKDPAGTGEKLLEKAQQAIEFDGAHALIFGCTGLIGFADDLQRRLLEIGSDVPVIDPLPVTVHFATAMVRSGLGHSHLSSPVPPAKQRPGYDGMPYSLRSSVEL